MRRVLTLFFLLVIGGLALAFWLTRPLPFSSEELPQMAGDAVAGRQVFLAAGCASCHADRGAEAQQAPILSGGRRLSTEFGEFITPNISSDPVHGIGSYDLAGLASVLKRGVTPDGRHLYPVMPYTSYIRMELQDIADLKAFLDSLPASDEVPQPHEISLPWSLRSTIGLWKKRYLDPNFVGAAPSERVERGRYLAEALGHCAECHTPRDRWGGLDRSRWMAGAPGLSGSSVAPNVTPAALDWSRDEVAWFLESGHSPRDETASNEMESVIAGLAQLPKEDLEALAFYLASLAPIE
ncbi:c-type cytochrome [Aliiruegeria lutimaris]|uniref:Cytochrome c, mono-and diheme variants n=1 Tax=Aliiruegeria lutimaris TaxID=571298 RepID=A0A1G9B5I5_9RHOB|nr:c-type cytochrome [Aliiruegeria lutimaris]SDK34781.1 Cytochrome c, mono-and diheme variants [Aliiruegeria lutimaris]